jgi:predicted flap endonuclease-1-like 5' DNA nuclease
VALPLSWPYLISVPALLLLGALLGWVLHATRSARQPYSTGSRLSQAQTEIKQKEEALHNAETELAHHEARLQTLNKTVSTTRQQVEDSEEEHKQLLMILDEWQASIQNAQDSLHTIRQGLQARSQETDDLISTIDKSLEEMDLLKKMQDSYQVKTNRLTQQVQWQDSELRMLRHTVQSKTSEISEARALLEQRDAELRLLIRQRQQREIDIANARKALSQRDNELRRMLGRESEPFVASGDRPPAPLPGSGSQPARQEPPRRVDVTPALPSTVSAGKPTARDEIEEEEDDTSLVGLDGGGGEQDITVIPRLADYYANQLRARGITTVRQLAEHTPEELRAMLTIPGHHSPHIENWVKTARRLSRQKK